MGEAAKNLGRDHRDHRDHSEDEIIRLRNQIEAKRAAISSELQLLRERRTEAMVQAKRTGRVVGVTALGALCFASLVNAVADIFRDEDAEPTRAQQTISAGLAGFAVLAMRVVAAEFIKSQLNVVKDRLAQDRKTAIRNRPPSTANEYNEISRTKYLAG